ncbi:putative ABC transport system permease protein [Aquimarina sp. MAR_2010_214]|uniref:ABC transporter permease n=1 Tax=Aquimarina sp. MAR_2010_214 TaxID=1250026 RepID=UPI000C70FF02|nr:ABC transporter permease [Aquimarina sp. MAR_2010_214]PKV51369.1 putative ABC transport system permease protein [Aquimarina sp. MAR_2010_214]
MNIWSISLQNIKSKPLYTFLSVFILSLSIALLLGIQQLKRSFKNQIENNLGKIDLVIGAKGSPLQLVLASVLHLDNPTGNISYNEAKKISKNPMVKLAVPISYGDNYKGFRIVGTTYEYTSLYNAELEGGRTVEKSMEVVLGNTVAQQLNLRIGDTFLSTHGLVENSIDIHSDDRLTVVGILKPTEKVIDRLIITNLESVWDVHNHESELDEEDENHTEHNHHNTHEEEKEITSLLINFKSPRALLTFPRKINKRTNLQAVLPKYELNKLYEYTSVGFQTISWIAYLILVISCVTIFISLYKMVKERAFDLAILRTYGASNFQLIKMVIYEGLIIAFSAFLLGFLLIKTGLRMMLRFMQSSYQQNMLKDLPFQEILQIGMLIFMMVILSVSLAIFPIIKMNISTILSNEK